MSEIPSVKILEAINPVNSGTGEAVLVYGGLVAAVDKYRPTNPQRSAEVWDSEPGSLEELSRARQLASEYLLRTSERVVDSHEGNRDLWADRFTQATTELYGAPERAEAARLLTNEYRLLLRLDGQEGISQQPLQFLLSTYKPIVETDSSETEQQEAQSDEEHERQAVYQYGEAMRGRYQPLFDLVDTAGKDEFTPNNLEDLFKKALGWLKDNDDPEWSEWSVVSKDGTSLSVDTTDRKIEIASRRETASLKDTRGLIAHELLVHCLRAKNGYKTGDKRLAIGLPGYLDTEEGLGILAEAAINGELPDKAHDRYVDIALAVGVVDGIQRSRQAVFQISYARQLIRAQLRGDKASIASLIPRVWSHVDRIYRGGPGDNLGTRQAIFTKDIAYYVGYKRMAAYITKQLDDGKSASEVFAYLSQAKFDPTNPKHIERLASDTP